MHKLMMNKANFIMVGTKLMYCTITESRGCTPQLAMEVVLSTK